MVYGNYPDLRGVRRVLVIKLRQLGDVLLTVPVFQALKKALPLAQLDAYVYREALPLLEDCPAISEILTYDREWKKLSYYSRLKREIRMLLNIRKRKYDLIIHLTEGDRGAIACYLSGAKIRVGICERQVYTHIVKNCPNPRHTVERQLDALRRIGIFPQNEDRNLFFNIPNASREGSKSKVLWDKFVLIHPTSRWRFKCWPVKQMRGLIDQLIKRGKNIVLTSGPDKEECGMIQEIAREHPQIRNLAGQITLQELAALVERCEVVICVDSLILHIASALKAPVVALFGPTSEKVWGPWRNPNARVVTTSMSCRPCCLDGCGGSKKSDCLETLSVEQVLLEIEICTKIRMSRLRIVEQLIYRS